MDRQPDEAFACMPINYGLLADGAVGSVLETARNKGLSARATQLANEALHDDPEGDVVLICCGPDCAQELASAIVHALGDPDTIIDEDDGRTW